MKLTFPALRVANTLRMPEFKNKHGELAHKKPDGSDWNPHQWFQALLGEIGEFARTRLNYDQGSTNRAEFTKEARKEAADVQTYLDICSLRFLDEIEEVKQMTPEMLLMEIVASLGEYANARKKFQRGDITAEQFEQQHREHLTNASMLLEDLMPVFRIKDQPTPVTHAAAGIDLGDTTIEKFNEVSLRVKSNVFITRDGVRKASSEREREIFAYNTDPTSIHPCYD
jgi:hypothetical protein